ncbi:MAG: Holliday junction resolvase RuvX [Candidatus Eisenbacteria bacterium]
MARVMGIDFGERRCGVAVSDPGGTIACSPCVIQAATRREAAERIRDIVQKEGVEEIVVGLPVSMSGIEGPQALKAREFAACLSQVCNTRVVLWDERLSTVQAQKLLLAAKKKTRRQKANRDLIAAVLILQSYLDSRARRTTAG